MEALKPEQEAYPGLVRGLAHKPVSLTSQPDFEISIMVYLMLSNLPKPQPNRSRKATFALPKTMQPVLSLHTGDFFFAASH